MGKHDEVPQVTAAEVTDWEENFRKVVSPLVRFDKQDNGYSMKFYNGESGIDAYWSGIIIMKSDNYIKWNFSLINGVFMDSKVNLDEHNKNIPANLYDFFQSWQSEVSKTITEPTEGSSKEMSTPPPASTQPTNLAGPESANTAPPAEPGATPLTESRKDKKRQSVILDSSERMRRLAGL